MNSSKLVRRWYRLPIRTHQRGSVSTAEDILSTDPVALAENLLILVSEIRECISKDPLKLGYCLWTFERLCQARGIKQGRLGIECFQTVEVVELERLDKFTCYSQILFHTQFKSLSHLDSALKRNPKMIGKTKQYFVKDVKILLRPIKCMIAVMNR